MPELIVYKATLKFSLLALFYAEKDRKAGQILSRLCNHK